MRKTTLVLGLFAAVAAWPAAHAAVTEYKATLGAAAEVPPTKSEGRGTAAVNVDAATMQLSWRVDYAGTTGPLIAAHIHCGAGPTGNAPVAVPLGAGAKLKSPITGSGKMTAAQLADLEAGKCYVNLHTKKNPAGEIRGQLAK